MSSDLYCSNLDEMVHGDCNISLKASGYLLIACTDPGDYRNMPSCGIFNLPPNGEGINEAKLIINAFQSWIELIEKR
jgi:hypothetical protein